MIWHATVTHEGVLRKIRKEVLIVTRCSTVSLVKGCGVVSGNGFVKSRGVVGGVEEGGFESDGFSI